MLEEHLSSCLVRVDAHAVVRDDGARRCGHLELLCNVLQDRRERSLLGDRDTGTAWGQRGVVGMEFEEDGE